MLPCEPEYQKVLKLVKPYIDSSVPFQEEIEESLQQAVFSSQRIRLASTMLVFFGQETDDFWQIVSAVECLSLAAMLHRQAEGTMALRHHQQQILWKTSGETQILSGDYLLTLALKMVNDLQRWDALELIATTTSKVALGQGQELNLDSTPESFLQMIQNRFAYLFATVSKGASMTLGHDDSVQKILLQYGLLFGTIISLKEMSLLENYNNVLSHQVSQILGDMQSNEVSHVKVLSDFLQEALTA